MKELELIRLYYYLCQCNDNVLWIYRQRFSHNCSPSNEKLDDIELLTIYLYSRCFENKQRKKDIYDYAKRYMLSWFPKLPNYANFNSRLNNLCGTIPYLIELLLSDLQSIENQNIEPNISLIDSLPVMLCSGKRQGKVAPELSEKSYCSTKGTYYFGVKLHVIAFRRKRKIPVPEYLTLTSGAEHDLEAIRPVLEQLVDRKIFADKAYANKEFQQSLTKNANNQLLTPIKLVKGESQANRQFKKAADDLFSKTVSVVRQPIESWFNWLIEKTDIQRASKVRNTKGLLLHVFGAIATALCSCIF